MTLIARKPSSAKQERLRRFVAQHAEALEPGLQIIEAGLRLGRTGVDLVAADARQTLVLIGVASVATDKMLVGMLDAYIWCLQFPDGLRRICPDAPIAFTRPPRLVVVAEEVPEAFMELVGCLSFEVECHELAADAARDAVHPPATLTEMPAAAGSTPASVLSEAPAEPAPAAAPTVPAGGAPDATAVPVQPNHVSLADPAGAREDERGPAAPAEVVAAAAEPDPEPETTAAAEPAPPPAAPSRLETIAATPPTEANGSGPARVSPPAASSPFSRNGRRVAGSTSVAAALRAAPTNGVRPPAGEPETNGRPGARGYVFAQAVRQPHPDGEPNEAPAVEPRTAAAAAAATSPHAAAPDAPKPAEPAEAGDGRRAPAERLLGPSGVSRQWQEFLARLASAQ
jgi:hypothetical protein